MTDDTTVLPGRRGYRPEDDGNFSPEAMETLQRAGAELSFLLDHDYPRESAVEFVGNRYQFTARQRLLLSRGVCGEIRRLDRAQKRLSPDDLAGKDVSIDGFNVIVPLEVALCGSPVIRAQDGAIRDLAGLSGTYHPIDQTMHAIDLALDVLTRAGARSATFYLDEPVSNSGRLAQTIREYTEALKAIHPDLPAVSAELVPDVDAELADREFVASNDSAVIDRAKSWLSVDAEALRDVPDAWVLDVVG